MTKIIIETEKGKENMIIEKVTDSKDINDLKKEDLQNSLNMLLNAVRIVMNKIDELR